MKEVVMQEDPWYDRVIWFLCVMFLIATAGWVWTVFHRQNDKVYIETPAHEIIDMDRTLQ
jgi:uncharacterized membrane protein YqjE